MRGSNTCLILGLTVGKQHRRAHLSPGAIRQRSCGRAALGHSRRELSPSQAPCALPRAARGANQPGRCCLPGEIHPHVRMLGHGDRAARQHKCLLLAPPAPVLLFPGSCKAMSQPVSIVLPGPLAIASIDGREVAGTEDPPAMFADAEASSPQAGRCSITYAGPSPSPPRPRRLQAAPVIIRELHQRPRRAGKRQRTDPLNERPLGGYRCKKAGLPRQKHGAGHAPGKPPRPARSGCQVSHVRQLEALGPHCHPHQAA
jgi:hypothetical protein